MGTHCWILFLLPDRLLPLAYESRPDAPEQVGALLKSEAGLWGRVIKGAGIAPLD